MKRNWSAIFVRLAALYFAAHFGLWALRHFRTI